MYYVNSLSSYPACLIIHCKWSNTQILTKECDPFFIKHNLLYKARDDRKLLVIPKRMQKNLIKKAHEIGHFSTYKVIELLNREYFL